MSARRFRADETVDFAVVGSGAAGGVIARELSQAGFSVLVFEQGPRLSPADFEHDELKYWLLSGITSGPGQENSGGAHLLGTCRMGNDPKVSVVDKSHRTHDVSNLFICDGSSFVTSGRGQPTMTIQALAFRAADHIGQFAKRNET